MTTAVRPVWPQTGELNRRVVIRVWEDRPNAGFGIDQVFDAGITRWAAIKPVVGVAYWGAKQIDEETTHRIWLRWGKGTKPEDITGQHVIDWPQENRRFRVIRATAALDARQMTMVEVKELGKIV
jgi:head-tail adaptor